MQLPVDWQIVIYNLLMIRLGVEMYSLRPILFHTQALDRVFQASWISPKHLTLFQASWNESLILSLLTEISSSPTYLIQFRSKLE